MHSTNHHLIKGVAYLLFALSVWAGWVVFSRLGVKGNLTPYDIIALRYVVAGLLTLPIIVKRGLKVHPYGIIGGIFLMFLMGAPYNIMTITGLKFAPAAHTSIVYAMTTIVTCIVGCIFLKERFPISKTIGVITAIIGIVLIMFAKTNTIEPLAWKGHILFIIAGAFWGVYAVLSREWRIKALHTTAVFTFWSMCFYIPFYIAFLPSNLVGATWQEIGGQGIYQGLFTNLLAMVAYNKSTEYLGATGSAAFIPLVPVLSALAAIPILHEIPTTMEWSGILLGAAGVFLASGLIGHSYRRGRALLQRGAVLG